MAYIKYKELTRYFNFNQQVLEKDIPSYVKQYVLDEEEIYLVYKVRSDLCVFTNKKLILFDIRGMFQRNKKIHFLPYSQISSSAIQYKPTSVSVYLSMSSGYQLRLNFVNQTADSKTSLRVAYVKMMALIGRVQ